MFISSCSSNAEPAVLDSEFSRVEEVKISGKITFSGDTVLSITVELDEDSNQHLGIDNQYFVLEKKVWTIWREEFDSSKTHYKNMSSGSFKAPVYLEPGSSGTITVDLQKYCLSSGVYRIKVFPYTVDSQGREKERYILAMEFRI